MLLICKIYFIVDNRYAKELLKMLTKLLRDKGLISNDVELEVSHPLNKCDNRIERYVNEAIKYYRCVVVLVDTEGRDPEEISNSIRENHLRGLGRELPNVRIITAHPCLEIWLCEALGLESCNAHTDCKDLISHIRDYLVRKRRIKYEKKLLPKLIIESLQDPLSKTTQTPPYFVKDLINILEICCRL